MWAITNLVAWIVEWHVNGDYWNAQILFHSCWQFKLHPWSPRHGVHGTSFRLPMNRHFFRDEE
jgi:hypothetical protein